MRKLVVKFSTDMIHSQKTFVKHFFEKYMFNLHTHTIRCCHATGRDEEYVTTAIKNGYSILGFADHAPYIYPNGYYSGMRMMPAEAEDYAQSINGLKEKYKGKIKILQGFELEYYPALLENENAFLKAVGYDYLILAQHFSDNEHEDCSIYFGAPTKSEDVMKRYINQLLEGARKGIFLYVAHPDLINYTGDESIYLKNMEYFLEQLKELDLPIEFNMLGFCEKRHYPNKKFWQLASKVGNKVVIGVEAHSPKSLSQIAKRRKATELLEELGITPLTDEEIMQHYEATKKD